MGENVLEVQAERGQFWWFNFRSYVSFRTPKLNAVGNPGDGTVVCVVRLRSRPLAW